jgi:hypothetical protein
MTNLKAFRKTTARFFALCAMAATVATAGTAFAGSLGTAKVTLVTQLGSNGGVGAPGLFINANDGTTFVTVVTSTTVSGACAAHAQTADTIKGMISIAEAALLSGKSVNLFWNTCGGMNYINRIDLVGG